MGYDITDINISIGCGSCENLKLRDGELFCTGLNQVITTLKKAAKTDKGLVMPKDNCPKDDKVEEIKILKNRLSTYNDELQEVKSLENNVKKIKNRIENIIEKTKYNVIVENIYDSNLSKRLASFLKENDLKVDLYYIDGRKDENLEIKSMGKYTILAYNSKEDISKLIQKGNIVEFEINGNISKELYKDNKS